MISVGLRRALRQSKLNSWRTVILAAVLGLAALGAWAFVVHGEARRQAVRETERSADVVAQAVAREQERLIDSAQQMLFGLSQRPEVLTANPGACASLVAGVVNAYAGYLDVVAARPDGTVFCSARGGKVLPGSAVPNDIALAAQSGATVVGKYGFDRTNRHATISVAVPAVDDGGAVRAVLVAALDLALLTRAVVETPLPAGASLMLINREGVILSHVPDAERWTGEFLDEPLRVLLAGRGGGLILADGLDGAATFFLGQPLLREVSRAGDGTVAVAVPRRAMFRDADRLFTLQLAGLGLAGLAAMIVAGLLVDRLVARPAYGVLRVVRSLTVGDVRARMRRSDTRGMVGRLARALETLARRMEEQQKAARRLDDELKGARAARLIAEAAAAPALADVPAVAPADPLVGPDAAYWGFREPPFANAPNPRFLWLSPAHSDALVRLGYALQQRRGCALLTGEPGCGKTLLTRAILQRLPPKQYEIALLTNPRGGRVELLREVLYELGVESAETSPTELLHLVHDLVVANHRERRETLIIVDDAQRVEDAGWFEELSGLLNIQTNEHTLVSILLVGSPELTARVHAMRHLDRRVSIRCELRPLDVGQTGLYVAYRLSVAGRGEPIFSPGAIAAIHGATHGVPSAINDLCDNALLWARLNGRRAVDESVIERVLGDTTRADVPRPV